MLVFITRFIRVGKIIRESVTKKGKDRVHNFMYQPTWPVGHNVHISHDLPPFMYWLYYYVCAIHTVAVGVYCPGCVYLLNTSHLYNCAVYDVTICIIL